MSWGKVILGATCALILLVGLYRGAHSKRPARSREATTLISAPVQPPAVAEAFADSARLLAAERLDAALERTKALHTLKSRPAFEDWLNAHPESPQTYAQFIASVPVRPSKSRSVIVIQPLGELSVAQHRVVTLTADYMHRFFGLTVRELEAIPAAAVPGSARRTNPNTGLPQLHTLSAMELVLRPRLPDDAFVFVAFTGEDLYPEATWNFVFGQAFPDDRTGLWSLARYGDPATSPEAFHLCLSRTMKVAVHETAHLLGLDHCQAYECVMNGCNSLAEDDRTPQFLCPVCTQKLVWSTGYDPVTRMERLKEFFSAHGFEEEALLATRELVALTSPP